MFNGYIVLAAIIIVYTVVGVKALIKRIRH